MSRTELKLQKKNLKLAELNRNLKKKAEISKMKLELALTSQKRKCRKYMEMGKRNEKNVIFDIIS